MPAPLGIEAARSLWQDPAPRGLAWAGAGWKIAREFFEHFRSMPPRHSRGRRSIGSCATGRSSSCRRGRGRAFGEWRRLSRCTARRVLHRSVRSAVWLRQVTRRTLCGFCAGRWYETNRIGPTRHARESYRFGVFRLSATCAAGYESEGRVFESPWAHLIFQPGGTGAVSGAASEIRALRHRSHPYADYGQHRRALRAGGR